MGKPRMSDDDGLLSEVGDCKAHFLCVLAILEYDLNFLCDGSVLIWGSIYIVNWYWVWQGQVSSFFLWAKAQLTNIPVTPEFRTVEVETERRKWGIPNSNPH